MIAQDPHATAAIDRHALLDWAAPHCEPNAAAILFPKGDQGMSPGWVKSREDSERAIAAYRAGTLAAERFDSVTKEGKPYTITSGTRLGLVPHRDAQVTVFCADLDDHTGDGGNVALAESLARFLGAERRSSHRPAALRPRRVRWGHRSSRATIWSFRSTCRYSVSNRSTGGRSTSVGAGSSTTIVEPCQDLQQVGSIDGPVTVDILGTGP